MAEEGTTPTDWRVRSEIYRVFAEVGSAPSFAAPSGLTGEFWRLV